MVDIRTNGSYEITPVEVEGYARANGVWVDVYGQAWLGEIQPIHEDPSGDNKDNTSGLIVAVYWDDEGDYIPAPEGWQDRIIREV